MTDTELQTTKQQAEFGQIVVLFELDLTALGGSVLRFTSSANGTTSIVFDGNTYVPIPVEADGFKKDSDGAFPVPKLRISNVTFATQSAIQGFNDLVGGKLTRIRTARKFLDDGIDPDPTAKFPDDVYFVDRKTAHNKVFVEWELKTAMDHEDKFLPGRQILRDSCSHIYRTWNGSEFDNTNATCPYTDFQSSDIEVLAGDIYQLPAGHGRVYDVGQTIIVSGFTLGGNNGTKTVLTFIEDQITVNESLSIEAAGGEVNIGSYFDISGNVELLPENDHCGKKLSSCRLRFTQNGVLPTRAFPGVQRVSG